jgi:hypothetical protein
MTEARPHYADVVSKDNARDTFLADGRGYNWTLSRVHDLSAARYEPLLERGGHDRGKQRMRNS